MDNLPDPSTLCMAPFAALKVGAEGRVSPCCEYVGEVGSLKKNSLREIWEGDILQDLRKALATGKKVKACWKCWQVEAANGISLRQSLNARFNDRLPSSLTAAAKQPDDPVYLDIRFSNLCNFRCRTCHHGASSRWFADAKVLGQASGKTALLSSFGKAEDAHSQFENIGTNVTDIYFAGGEPLLEKQHFELLRYLIAENRTDIRLSYNTNLSTLDFEGSDIVNLWRKFPHVHIEASIDATGEAGAFIRHGFDWGIFRENLDRLREACPHANVYIGVTVSVFNLLKLVELHSTLVNDCGMDSEAFGFHPVQAPRYYDIAILPKGIKERATVQLETYAAELHALNADSKVAAQLLHIVRHLEDWSDNTAAARGQFQSITTQLDELRSENALILFPELSSLMQTKAVTAPSPE